MKKLKLISLCVFLLVISGCGGYKRDERPGKIERITVAQMEEKMKQKDDFAIFFTQSWCQHCEEMKEMLDGYLKDHHVVLYEVSIDQDPIQNRTELLTIIRSYFEGLDSTPSTYYVEDGKVKNELEPDDNGVTEVKFDSWVQNNRLDEKKGE